MPGPNYTVCLLTHQKKFSSHYTVCAMVRYVPEEGAHPQLHSVPLDTSKATKASSTNITQCAQWHVVYQETEACQAQITVCPLTHQKPLKEVMFTLHSMLNGTSYHERPGYNYKRRLSYFFFNQDCELRLFPPSSSQLILTSSNIL